MEIQIEEEKWFATIMLTPQDQGTDILHLEARLYGLTPDDVLGGAKYILDLFAKGRTAYIRAEPESVSAPNLNTKAIEHRGFVRFSFRLDHGEWHLPDRSHEHEIQIRGFGALESQP
jgi:hypothetical protein